MFYQQGYCSTTVARVKEHNRRGINAYRDVNGECGVRSPRPTFAATRLDACHDVDL